MQNTGVGIGDMGCYHCKLEVLHENLRGFSSALDTEGNNAAGTVGQILLRKSIVFAGGKPAIVNPSYLLMGFEEFGDGLAVTLSIGLADASRSPIESALHDADFALYEAKRLGRNRVIVAAETT